MTASNIEGRPYLSRSVRRIVMESIITPEIVVAYSQCPRKAYNLLYTDKQGIPHEYIAILEEEARKNRENHLKKIMGKHSAVGPYPYHTGFSGCLAKIKLQH